MLIVDNLVVAVGAQRAERVVYANRRLAELLEYESPLALLGRSIWELVHPDEHVRVRARIALGAREDGAPYSATLITSRGQPVPVVTFPQVLAEHWARGSEGTPPLHVSVAIPLSQLAGIQAPALPALTASPLSRRPESRRRPSNAGRHGASGEFGALTGRESQVMDAIVAGQSVQLTAAGLGISPNTVRSHLKSIFRRMGVRSRAELLSVLIRDRA